MLIELMIAQICAGTIGTEREACMKAVEAASIQYNIKAPVGSTEKATVDFVERKVETVTGKEALAVVLFTAKVVRDKEVSGNLIRERGKMPATNMSVGQGKGRVTFSWSF